MRLVAIASIPAIPVADTGKVSLFFVWNVSRSISQVSSMISIYCGSKCPSVGADSARKIRLGTVLGPGTIKIRSAGFNYLYLFMKNLFLLQITHPRPVGRPANHKSKGKPAVIDTEPPSLTRASVFFAAPMNHSPVFPQNRSRYPQRNPFFPL